MFLGVLRLAYVRAKSGGYGGETQFSAGVGKKVGTGVSLVSVWPRAV